MELVTGRRGFDHFTAAEFREILKALFGSEIYLLADSGELNAELISNNLIRIHEGVVVSEGCVFKVNKDTYDDITIQNGTQGMKRIDLIVGRYVRNVDTGIESVEWNVKQGTPSNQTPIKPAYTQGSITNDDLIVEIPVFEVHIDGLNVTEVVSLVTKKTTGTAELSDKYQQTTVQLLNGFKTNSGETTIPIYKHDNLVFFYTHIKRESTPSSSLPVLIFPEGYRPRYQYHYKHFLMQEFMWVRDWSGEFMAGTKDQEIQLSVFFTVD